MSRIPREARDGLARAWLDILRERHPGVSWIEAKEEKHDTTPIDRKSNSVSV
jgi:hypothetical protein